MQSKTRAGKFEFEKALHERVLETEREIVADVTAASDVEANPVESTATFTGGSSEAELESIERPIDS